jgi:hypothetical protein
VKEAQRYAKEGRRYVVDIDIAKFCNHSQFFSKKVQDVV